MDGLPRQLRQLADPRRFPALTAFIDSGVFDAAETPDDEFAFGLERILDGVAALPHPAAQLTTTPLLSRATIMEPPLGGEAGARVGISEAFRRPPTYRAGRPRSG